MKKIVLHLLRGYQKRISPMKRPCCRFEPTCSQYALEAVERFGSVRGLWMGFCRVLRCNPFHKGGYDPVPVVISEFTSLAADLESQNSE